MIKKKRRRYVFVSSMGGHFEQLKLLAMAGYDDPVLVSTYKDRPTGIRDVGYFHIPECNADSNLFTITKCFVISIFLVFRLRPRVVVSTGALPGLIFGICSKIILSHFVWVDSVANVGSISKSGKVAAHLADDFFTQWPHLAQDEDILYLGTLL